MEITYSDITKYPLTKFAHLEEIPEPVELGVGATAVERLQDFVTAKVGTKKDGKIKAINDPFLRNVYKLAHLHQLALSTLEAIAEGSFKSTPENPQYVGGVVSEGNRLLTPAEGAANSLARIKFYSIPVEGKEVTGLEALENVNTYTRAAYQAAIAIGDMNPTPPPFFKDLTVLMRQYITGCRVLELIAKGSYSSTDEKPQYAGGNVSPGNRIYTPAEGAAYALKDIKAFA